MNFAEINPIPNYGNNYQLDNYHDNNVETRSFSKSQEGLSEIKKKKSYYCNGNANLNNSANLETTELRKIFFSEENLNRIQHKIKKEIKKQSKGQYILYVDQDESDLIIAMNAVFELYGRNLSFKIIRQVKELNQHTLDYIVPDMLTNLRQSGAYLKQLDKFDTIDRPLNVNTKGGRTLPSYTSVWGF
jgi:hypothetical protein